ncbi:MAG: 30S ribosome-binding factor RbfA [Armatimonadetes bacterium]|nr:MAG: 30S ribosome-binding factor RbfA [Armatimonadota bacterium]
MARQNSPRMRKVNELVREIVAESVLDLKDPRIGFLTITGTETSPDLRHAIVYYSVMGTDDEKRETADALASATPRLQREIGSQSKLRYTPKLEFRVDPAIDEGLKINQMVKDLSEDRHQKSDVRSQESSLLDSKEPDAVGIPTSDGSESGL